MNKTTTYTTMKWKDHSPRALASEDIMYAPEEPEFFYKRDDSVVPEGEPIGLDIDKPESVELVLF